MKAYVLDKFGKNELDMQDQARSCRLFLEGDPHLPVKNSFLMRQLISVLPGTQIPATAAYSHSPLFICRPMTMQLPAGSEPLLNSQARQALVLERQETLAKVKSCPPSMLASSRLKRASRGT